MHDAAERLDKELREAGLNIVGVSIGDVTDTSTWRAQPSVLQAQAQPIIDAIVLSDWERDEQFADLRVKRNQLLVDSDWTQLADVSDLVEVGDWQVYRQELRDLPENTSDPVSPVWPTPPE